MHARNSKESKESIDQFENVYPVATLRGRRLRFRLRTVVAATVVTGIRDKSVCAKSLPNGNCSTVSRGHFCSGRGERDNTDGDLSSFTRHVLVSRDCDRSPDSIV